MIAFLINELDIRGGTHKQLLKLLDYTERQGDPFYIITRQVDFSKTYPEFKRYEKQIRLFPYDKKSKNPFNQLKQMRLLRRMVSDADCINVHDCGFEILFPAFWGKKVVWQVNDLPYYFQIGASSNVKISWKGKMLKPYLVCCGRFVTDFCVNVSKNRDRIQKTYNRDAHVFYCGIEPINIERNIEEAFDRFKERKIHILSSGVFFPYRNYETQIDVVDNLRKNGIDATLRIIGSTSLNKKYASKIQTMIDERNLSEHITICGLVDDDEFRRLHAESDIFIFINLDQSWGLAVFEAMSCGLPVVVSNSVGATEILTNSKNAIFVDPKDSDAIVATIQQLMGDESYYRRISDNAGRFHTQYTWDNAYCSKMLDLIKVVSSK